jgi:hypothetical protein
MDKIQELRKKFKRDIAKLAPKERIFGFMRYCREVIAAQEKGEITLEEAGQLVLLGNLYDEDLTAYYIDSPDAFATDEILEIARNMDTLPDYYPEGRRVADDWKRLIDLANFSK